MEERIRDYDEMEGPKIWGGELLTPTDQLMDFGWENNFSYEKKAS